LRLKTKNLSDLAYLLDVKKGLIFDLDGTIADTETSHWEAYNELLKPFNIHLDDSAIRKYIGNSEVNIYKQIKQDYGINFDDDIFFDLRTKVFFQLIENKKLKPFHFISDCLSVYKQKKLFILSSQRYEVIIQLLNYWDYNKTFNKIISVANGPSQRRLY